ncbi:cell division inhibitor, a membrane ATPase,activates minC [Acinetobacter baumannii]|nr:cell division inhibitor, a membrane ATPase,activates minC [Acinetobacter baumannii]
MTIIGVDSVAKIVVVTSGKGGVGKTTTSASFATGLALRGHKTVVIDFDVGLRNLDELSQEFDYIICDSPAGIERGAILAMYHADEAIIVTNPEISSVRDSDRIIGMLDSKTKKVEHNEGRIRKHLCITRFNPERADRQEMLTIDDISKDILRVPTLGVIPECPSVLQASNEGKPVILYSETKAGQAYDDLVARFLGEDRPYRHITAQPKGWLARLFGA